MKYVRRDEHEWNFRADMNHTGTLAWVMNMFSDARFVLGDVSSVLIFASASTNHEAAHSKFNFLHASARAPKTKANTRTHRNAEADEVMRRRTTFFQVIKCNLSVVDSGGRAATALWQRWRHALRVRPVPIIINKRTHRPRRKAFGAEFTPFSHAFTCKFNSAAVISSYFTCFCVLAQTTPASPSRRHLLIFYFPLTATVWFFVLMRLCKSCAKVMLSFRRRRGDYSRHRLLITQFAQSSSLNI